MMRRLMCFILIAVLLSSSVAALQLRSVRDLPARDGVDLLLNIDDASDVDTKVLVILPELGVARRLGPLDGGDEIVRQRVFLDTPGARDGFYWLHVVATNDRGEREVVNRIIWID